MTRPSLPLVASALLVGALHAVSAPAQEAGAPAATAEAAEPAEPAKPAEPATAIALDPHPGSAGPDDILEPPPVRPAGAHGAGPAIDITRETATAPVAPDPAGALYERAYEAYHAGRWRQADRLVEQAIAADPTRADTFKLRGYLAARRKDHAAVLQAADAAIAVAPDDGEAWHMRANAHHGLGQREQALADYRRTLELDYADSGFYRNYLYVLNERHDYDAMVDVYDAYARRTAADPGRMTPQADIPFHAAQATYARGDHARTVRLLDQAIAIEPGFHGYYGNRALAYEAMGRHALALADYATAIRLAPRDPLNYYNRGVAWLAQRDFERAHDDFSKAQSLGMDNADLWLNLGVTLEHRGQPRRALQAYDRALRLDPDNAKAKGNRATVLATHGRGKDAGNHALTLASLPNDEAAVLRYNDAQARMRQGDWPAVVPLLEEALRLKPDFEQAWVNLAAAHAHLGARQRALDVLDDVIRRYPDSTHSLLNRAQLLDDLGDADAARRDFERAVRLAPTDADAMALFGQHFARAGDRRDAEAWFERARRTGVAGPALYINYSALLLQAGDDRQALAVAREGARRHPDDYALLINLANAQAGSGQPRDAIDGYRRAIRLQPERLDAYFNLANLYAVDGDDYAQGIQWYRRALQRQPDPALDAAAQREQRVSVRLNLASALENSGDHAGALQALAEAIAAEPADYRAYFNRAGMRLADGDGAGAEADFRDALARMKAATGTPAGAGGDDPELLEYMGYAQFHLHQPEAAVASLERSLQLRPDSASTLRNYGYVLLDLGRAAQAKTQFDRAFTREPDEVDGWLGLLACTALAEDARALARLKAQFAKRFEGRYALDRDLPTRLMRDGYWYSDRFLQLWARLVG